MAKEDNTLLYVALGAALFFMLTKTKLVNAAVPPAQPALPPASSGAAANAAASGGLTANNSDMGGNNFGVTDPTSW